ncbi:MAG: DNA replication and repair protein RecF [Prevotellaceae bacterium]|nr:DNA replication and repair protein RecF [Prevotellaceae bacterium]
MRLKRLSILNYKNIAQAELNLSDGINCLVGDNGEGKTNLLDAVYFLSMCKSATTSQDSLTVRHGQQFMALQGYYEREDGSPEEVCCGLKPGQKKSFSRGKKAYKRLADHIGVIPVVVVSPTDQSLITGGSEERRRFMDLVISQCEPSYLDSLMSYNKALMQRNALLKMEEEPDTELLSLWEDVMGREGELIFNKREQYIDLLKPAFQRYYSAISPEGEEVGLQYVSHCQRGPLTEVIRQSRPKDRIVGYSLHGIHKDEIEMTLDGYPIKREGSQGQNKSFLVALKLAQFDFLKQSGSRTTPILLLDDIFDKLDASRVARILRLVEEDHFGQIFITDTNRDHLGSLLTPLVGKDYHLFHVKAGEIMP